MNKLKQKINKLPKDKILLVPPYITSSDGKRLFGKYRADSLFFDSYEQKSARIYVKDHPLP